MNKSINVITLSELSKRNSDGFLPVLIEIYNPDIKWEDGSLEQENMYLRVINDVTAVKYKEKTYIPCRFDFEPPEENGSKLGTANISISAIDSRVPQLLRSVKDQLCEIRIVAAFAKKDGTKFIFMPMKDFTFFASGASYTNVSAQLSLANDDVFSLNIPRDVASKDMLPSVNENKSS